MLIIIKEKYHVSIFQSPNQFGFRIHNREMRILMTYYIVILQLWTLFKMFKTCFLKFEFLALFFGFVFNFELQTLIYDPCPIVLLYYTLNINHTRF
jgi:hypothetical protein